MTAPTTPLDPAQALREALLNVRDWLRSAPLESGYCCCGSPVKDHGMGDGHSPVDELAYSASGQVEMIDAALAQPAAPAESDEDEAYEIGKREGWESAYQDIDLATGGDGEYFASTIPGHGCPDWQTMKAGILERFAAKRAPAVDAAEIVEMPRTPTDEMWEEFDQFNGDHRMSETKWLRAYAAMREVAPRTPASAPQAAEGMVDSVEAARLVAVLRTAQAHSDQHGEDMIRAANMLERLAAAPPVLGEGVVG